MYTLSSKLKIFSIVLMIVGFLGIGYGFLTAPKNIQDVEQILASSDHGHEGGHEVNHDLENFSPAIQAGKPSNASEIKLGEPANSADSPVIHDAQSENIITHTDADKTSSAGEVGATVNDTISVVAQNAATPSTVKVRAGKVEVVDEHAEHQDHLHHVLQQLQNKPWAALYVACIFFLLMTMGVLAFYAINYVAQAGWSPVLERVMQAMTAYLPVGSIIFFIILILCGLNFNHLFIWLDKDVVAHDTILQNKSGYLNFPFWIIRAAIFLLGWNLYRYFSLKYSLNQDQANDDVWYKKNFNISAIFLVFFIVTESISSWDWIMSVEPHWFSTLFGWYVFASFIVSGITAICMVTVYMKSRGYLPHVNTSHVHDLAKYMFGFSIFWTYLWFSQFMLIWYANIPEEITYFVTRINVYNLPFFGAVVMNFVFPILILMNTDFKRMTWVLVMAGVVILLGHYIDFFNMIMPSTVGDQWFIGIPEICSLLFFLGLFIFVVFSAMAKYPLLAERNPYIEESKQFHY